MPPKFRLKKLNVKGGIFILKYYQNELKKIDIIILIYSVS